MGDKSIRKEKKQKKATDIKVSSSSTYIITPQPELIKKKKKEK